MADLLPRLEREPGNDDTLRGLLDELRALPGVDPRRTLQRARLVVPVELAMGEHTARLFSTITTLGTAQDITTQELRIEAFHAADAESRAVLGRVLGDA
jgi:MmyB-like transcription regulator ligand binding domain